MGVSEHSDDGTVWIDGEAYSPLTHRERTFLTIVGDLTRERDEARQQLRGAVDRDLLVGLIAAELDKPSLYMGGPSPASKRKAEVIMDRISDHLRGAVDRTHESLWWDGPEGDALLDRLRDAGVPEPALLTVAAEVEKVLMPRNLRGAVSRGLDEEDANHG